MSGSEPGNSLRVAVIYADLPDLIELETRVRIGEWSGVATTYAEPVSMREAAEALAVWSTKPQGECRIEAGADTGIGWLVLRFYSIDMAGHTVCHVTLATSGPADGREEETKRLSMELTTETGLIERFAHQLIHLSERASGSAVLQIVGR